MIKDPKEEKHEQQNQLRIKFMADVQRFVEEKAKKLSTLYARHVLRGLANWIAKTNNGNQSIRLLCGYNLHVPVTIEEIYNSLTRHIENTETERCQMHVAKKLIEALENDHKQQTEKI